MSRQLVSIIIPHYNERELLRECLESFERRDYDPIEIIVVDNGSNDGSRSMVETEFSDVTFLEIPSEAGLGKVNNAGLEHASGDIIAFDFNNDETLEQGWLRRLVETLNTNPDVKIVSGLRLQYDDPNRVDSAGVVLDRFGRPVDYRGDHVESLPDAPLRYVDYVEVPVFHRELLEEVGYLDEGYHFYSEDADFCLRAKRRGYKVAVVRDAVTRHRRGASADGMSPESRYYLFRNRLRMYTKTLPVTRLVPILLWWGIFWPAIEAIRIATGRADYARTEDTKIENLRINAKHVRVLFSSLAWNVRNLGDTLAARRESLK